MKNPCLGYLFSVVFAALPVMLGACAYTYEDYCTDRAHAECRQLYEGACFTKADRPSEAGKDRAGCEGGFLEKCMVLNQAVTAGELLYDDDSARRCTDLLEAIACNDYRQKVSSLAVCNSVTDSPDDDFFRED